MNSLIWFVTGTIVVLSALIGGYFIGHKSNDGCQTCPQLLHAQVLKEQIVAARKVILTEVKSKVEATWTLNSQWPKLANKVAKSLRLSVKADAVVVFDATYAFGYDLRKSWKLTVSKTTEPKVVVEIPSLQLVACPSVLTHTLEIRWNKSSLLVGEKAREPEVLRLSTFEAVNSGYDMLRIDDKRKALKKAADEALVSLIIDLARPLGLALQPGDVVVQNQPASDHEIPAAWAPDKTLSASAYSEAMAARMVAAGCAQQE